jgi:hypothetical protein
MDREEQMEVLLKHIYSRYLMSWYSCSEGLREGDWELFVHYTELFPEVVKHWMLGKKGVINEQ